MPIVTLLFLWSIYEFVGLMALLFTLALAIPYFLLAFLFERWEARQGGSPMEQLPPAGVAAPPPAKFEARPDGMVEIPSDFVPELPSTLLEEESEPRRDEHGIPILE